LQLSKPNNKSIAEGAMIIFYELAIASSIILSNERVKCLLEIFPSYKGIKYVSEY